MEEKPRPGRPRKLSKDQVRHMKDKVCTSNTSTRDIAKLSVRKGRPINHTTVFRALKRGRAGLDCKKAIKKPYTT